MEFINYYDVSCNQHLAPFTGQRINIEELIDKKRYEDRVLFESKGLVRNIGTYDFDPLCIKKTSRWENALATMVYAVSGQIPNREEIKRGRQIIERSPHEIKETVDRSFVLCFLPYLLTGFNFHLGNNFVEGSNNVDNAVGVMRNMLKCPQVHARSFLCAHRESHKVKKLSLRDHIHQTKAERALNLELGLLTNIGAKKADIVWYQQGPTEKASANMFPEIFLGYLQRGEISSLVKTLELHQLEARRLMARVETGDLRLELKPLDEFTCSVESFLLLRYDNEWNGLQNLHPHNQDDKLVEIASKMALPEVMRLMPSFDDPSDRTAEIEKYREVNLAAVENGNEGALVNSIINWFANSQQMTAFGKALYETALYYLWGAASAKNSEVGIGIDRDHTDYQHHAFKLGFIENNPTCADAVPLIYARRVDVERPGGILRDISFRQFWRDIN